MATRIFVTDRTIVLYVSAVHEVVWHVPAAPTRHASGYVMGETVCGLTPGAREQAPYVPSGCWSHACHDSIAIAAAGERFICAMCLPCVREEG